MILGLLVAVFVGALLPLTQLIPQRAYADILSDTLKQESLYEYGNLVKACMKTDGSGLHTENVRLTGTPSTSNWISGNMGYSGDIETVVTLPKDESRWCGDILTQALTAFGYTSSTYGEFLQALGYSCSTTECNLTGRQEDIPNKFTQLLKTKNIPTARTKAMTYVQLQDGMKWYCAMSQIDTPSTAEQASAEENKDGYILVYTTTNSGATLSAEKSYFKYDPATENVACVGSAADLRDASKSVVESIVQDFDSTAKQKYLASAVGVVCGLAPSAESLYELYQACVARVTEAFNPCWDSTLQYVARFGSNTPNAFPTTLAGCLEGHLSISKDKFMPGFLQVQSDLSDLAGSLTTTDQVGGDAGDDCPLPAGTSLRWLGCAVFDGLKGFADGLAKSLNSLLYTPTAIFDEPAAQKAASTFRNIGIALVVIAGLFMVIAEASGWQVVDAYTIRKLMPRLALVLVGIALAWPIMRLIVTLTNDLGGLIHSVFLQLAGDVQATGDVVGTGSSITAVLGWILVGGGLFITLGVLGMLSLLGTIVLALFIGFLVLGVRQLVVLMCIILAPLALASYVLPGTQKLWTFWKNTFITTLLMYPLIMGFIGAGKAMAYLLGATKAGSTDNIMQLLVIIVYFAPYFMLPFAFKMAGGLMSTIFSIANDKNRGLFDRLKNGRQEIRKSRKHRADEGHLFDEKNPFVGATGLNKVANMWGDPKNTLAYSARRIPGFRTAGTNAGSLVEAKRLVHSRKLVEEMNGNGANSEFWRAISGSYETSSDYGGYSNAVRSRIRAEQVAGRLTKGKPKTLSDFQKMADILETTAGATQNEVIGGQLLRSQAGRLASMYKDSEIGKADTLSASIMGMASHGYIDGNDLEYVGNSLVAEGMGDAAAAGVLAQAQIIGGGARPDIKAGYGVTTEREDRVDGQHVDENGKRYNMKFVDGMKDTGRADALLKSMKGPELANAKPQTIKKIESHIRTKLQSNNENEARAMRTQLFSWASRYSGASQEFMTEALNLIDSNGLRAEFDRMDMSSLSDTERGGAPGQMPPGQDALPGMENLGGGGHG
jgi:hypothetical protein